MREPPAHSFIALTTDLYEVTMACGYWKAGVSDYEAAFHVTFRENPFGGEFTVDCGLATAIDFLRTFHFTETQIAYLGSQHGNDGKPLFDSGFLDYLRGLQLTCDIDAVAEGTLVFPNEPLIRVCGPIAQCQLLETALLNILNFQSLIATKAARVCLAAQSDPVIEFGLRRAQGVDGGLTAARAAYIGGCAGTSNLQAGERFGIPVSGTQAHSWIMFFENEREAFETYARAMPNNCVLLVDTYNSIEGVRHAGCQSEYRSKLSDEAANTSCPGLLQVRRFQQPDGRFIADAIYETGHAISEPCVVVDLETEKKTEIPAKTDYSDLLVPVFRRDQLVYQTPNIEASREHARKQLDCAPPEILRLKNPKPYKIGLERSLHELR